MDDQKEPFLPWLEETCKSMMEGEEPEAVVAVALFKEGVADTHYYNASLGQTATAILQILGDIVLGIIEDNAEEIREMLDGR